MPEFCDEWRREIRRRLLRFWEQIPQEDRHWLDLDGDGATECVAVARDVARMSWHHDFRFVAVLRRAANGRWTVWGFTRLARTGRKIP